MVKKLLHLLPCPLSKMKLLLNSKKFDVRTHRKDIHMPNWCTNHVYIDADFDSMVEIEKFVKSEEREFDFERIIPMPENIFRGDLSAEAEKLYGKNNWYDWSWANWGTKWNTFEVLHMESGDYWFDTAWSPCKEVIAKLATLFPQATIRYWYYDEGHFYGMSLYEGGELTFRMDGEYQINYLTQHPKVFNESELEKECIEDTLFPLHELGYVYKATDDGKIHLRVYSHGMLYVKVDGEYEGKTVLDAAEVLLNEWIPSDAYSDERCKKCNSRDECDGHCDKLVEWDELINWTEVTCVSEK